ncbi:histidine kinase [Cellulosimicrobium sp. Marseille-Q4280]|uniref:sensor histidine kinase n=1 Tax=Cellulosimicrobium sp. Marseille-Q4280 TaxID=2937992 RepID=UPI00203BA404|nr:histidine kinase [Cellulosimicrobium sp. Marseille-Q4280]
MSSARWWSRDGALRQVWRLEDSRNDVVTAVMTFALGWVLIEVGLVDLVSVDGAIGIVTPEPWWRYALLAVGCALILVKRRRPMLALAGGVVVMLVDLSWGGSLAITVVLWDLLYAAATWGSPRARAWLWGVTVTVSVLGAVAAGEAARDVRVFVYTGLQLGAVLLLPLWWATNVRQKTELADLERDRADLAARDAASAARAAELERERASDLERIAELDRHEAVRAERAAMARDLHDVIASHLSAIAIHSGAALQLPPDATRDRAALEQVRTSAVTSLEEMRSMILLLRSERRGSEPVVAPGRLAEIGTLLDAARATGTEVTFTDDPRAAGLPAAVDQTLYRVAQEALTNALKHAPGAPVAVRLERSGDDVVLTVHDHGTPAPTPLGDPALSAGTGLLTMRERAEGVGGTLDAGPADGSTGGGGWTVRAAVPAAGPTGGPASASGAPR